MEPKGKLNDADWPAGREKGFPGGPVLAKVHPKSRTFLFDPLR